MKITGCLLWILLACNDMLWSQESFFVARKRVTGDPGTHIITAAQEYVFLKDTMLNDLAFRQYAVLTFTDYTDGVKETDTICIHAGPQQFEVLNSGYQAIVVIEGAVTDTFESPVFKDVFFSTRQQPGRVIVLSDKELHMWYDADSKTWTKWSDGVYLYEVIRDIPYATVKESLSKRRISGPFYDLLGADSFVFNHNDVFFPDADAIRMSFRIDKKSGNAYTVKAYNMSGQREGRRSSGRKLTYRVHDTFFRVNNQSYPIRAYQSNIIVKHSNTDSSRIIFSWLNPFYTNTKDTTYTMDLAVYTYGRTSLQSVFPNTFYSLYTYPSYLTLEEIYNTRDPAGKFVSIPRDLPPRLREETGIEHIYADNDSVYVLINVTEPAEMTVTITDGPKEHRFGLGKVTATGRSEFALHCRIRPSENYPVSLSTRMVKDGRSYSRLVSKTMFVKKKE